VTDGRTDRRTDRRTDGIAIAYARLEYMLSRAKIVELGRRISANSKEECDGAFLFQRLSVVLQRFNSVLLRDSFVTSVTCRSSIVLSFFVFLLLATAYLYNKGHLK